MEQSTKAKQNLEARRDSVRAGEFYSINTVKARGHKGQLRDVTNKGTGKAVIVTHSEYTHRKKNWRLDENPQGTPETAYLVAEPEDVVIKKHLGKHHLDMRITNKVDKSKVRHILKQNKKKKG